MVSLNDFIHVHPNALSDDICDELVSYFEDNVDKHEYIDNGGCPTFTQLNLTRNREDKEDIHNTLIGTVFNYRDRYYEYVFKDVFPKKHSLEEFRIKRYNASGREKFDAHVDVLDYSTARRFLSFFWYLNDVEEGGKTIFNSMEITPAKGSLVIFPPLWMFPHKGEPPISGPKYLISTYLHYQ